MNPRLLSILLVISISCNNEEICDANSQSELVVLFKTMEGGVISDTTLSGVTMYGIREGKPDSLLYDAKTVSSVMLPLDPHYNFSNFVLRINEKSDTLRISHTNSLYLMSYTCGYATLFTLDNIGHGNTMIRDVEMRKALVDAEYVQDEEHLWIYF